MKKLTYNSKVLKQAKKSARKSTRRKSTRRKSTRRKSTRRKSDDADLQVFSYSLTFESNRPWSSEELHLSGVIIAEDDTEALEKSMLILNSKIDTIYRNLINLQAKILFSCYDDENYNLLNCKPLTIEEAKDKIFDEIKVELASEFNMKMTGHTE